MGPFYIDMTQLNKAAVRECHNSYACWASFWLRWWCNHLLRARCNCKLLSSAALLHVQRADHLHHIVPVLLLLATLWCYLCTRVLPRANCQNPWRLSRGGEHNWHVSLRAHLPGTCCTYSILTPTLFPEKLLKNNMHARIHARIEYEKIKHQQHLIVIGIMNCGVAYVVGLTSIS